MTVAFEDIQQAAARIRSGIYMTPCPASVPLSLATDCQIYCKLDYLQRTGSFKERGARNSLLLLNDEQRGRGVIAASAGNHALGLAYHAGLLDIPVTVVMPEFAPMTKVVNCQQLGARVLQRGATIRDARKYAEGIQQEQQLTYINGYNDEAIIAGQGTLGLEVVEQVPDLDAVLVPIGGGGLIAGVALAVKTLRPDAQVIGIEPKRAASFTAALEAGEPVAIDMSPTLADGLAVPQVGDKSFAIARQHVDRVVTVSERAIARAILRLIELEKSVVEGAAATTLAALLASKLPELQGKKVVLPLCGGNIDTSVLGRIIERGLAADGRMCRFEATISDRPGGLARLTRLLADEGASIQDIAHDRAFAGEDISSVVVHCTIETRDSDHIRHVRDRLMDEGFAVRFHELTG